MMNNRLQTDANIHERLDLRSTVMLIDNELHDEDVESIKFLCQGLIVGKKLKRVGAAHELISLLESGNHVKEEDFFILADLLQYIGRIDVLERIGYAERDVFLDRQQTASKIHPFFVLLFQMAEELADEDVKKAAFMYGKVPRSTKLSSGLDLFTVMVQHQAIHPEDVQQLITIFVSLERQDLVELVNRYRETRGQSVMDDLVQNFHRAMSLRTGANFSNGFVPQSQGQPQKGFTDCMGPSIHDRNVRDTRNLPTPSQVSDYPSIANQPPSMEHTDPTAPPLSLPSMRPRDPSLPPAAVSVAPPADPAVQFQPPASAAPPGYDNLAIPWNVLDILSNKIPVEFWQEFSYRLGIPLSTAEVNANKTSPFHNLAILKRWLDLPETRAMDSMTTQVFLIKALDDAGPKLMAKEIAMILSLDYSGILRESISSQGSSEMNEISSAASAAHVSMEVAQTQQESMGNAGDAPLAQAMARVPQLSLNRSPIPHYKMDNIPRGFCIIINNREFYKDRRRPHEARQMVAREGTNVDRDKLQATFNQLNFHVTVYENCTDFDMIEIIRRTAMEDHTLFDCFVCCILTHGVHGALYGTNGITVPIRDMTGPLRAQACPSLAGKPKLFFMQACQGREKQEGHLSDMQVDSAMEADGPSELIPNESDFLLGYATVPGFVSYRSKTRGSWYITKLTESLNKHAFDHDILDILTLVNYEVGKGDALIEGGQYKQSPAPMYSLRKKLIFGRPSQ